MLRKLWRFFKRSNPPRTCGEWAKQRKLHLNTNSSTSNSITTEVIQHQLIERQKRQEKFDAMKKKYCKNE